jgi:hypothetical protein
MIQSYTNLISKLKDKLEALVDESESPIFHEVYDYPENNFSGYPVAVILDKGGGGQVIDTSRIERAFTFDVLLYQEQSIQGKNKEEAAAILRSIVDRVILSFDSDPQLGGEVMRVLVANVSLDFTAAAGVHNFARFTIQLNDFTNSHE